MMNVLQNKTRHLFSIIALLFVGQAQAQVVLNADGPGDTYSLITSVLAPGQNPIETPDCSHEDFGDHIDEIFDEELNDFVFRFHMHTDIDDDRCINFDRQRNEIKSYGPSPDNLLGIEGETVEYIWKFKLNEGFQSSSSFTHLHQLKSVGGPFASIPIYTLTTRKGTPDQLELRYAVVDDQTTLKKTDLEPFIGHWLEVVERIKYGHNGSYKIKIRRVDDGTLLFEYADGSIINWRENADFVRPKWGIYRSLNSAGDLRDEEVYFNNFSIEEIEVSSTSETEIYDQWTPIHDPVANVIHINNIPSDAQYLQLVSINGLIMKAMDVDPSQQYQIDVSQFNGGIYIVNLQGKNNRSSSKIFIAK